MLLRTKNGGKGQNFLVNRTWPQILNFENAWELPSETSDEIKTVLKSNPTKDFCDIFVGATFYSTVGMESIIDCKHYSNVNRMYRVTVYVLQFVNNLKAKIEGSCVIDQAELQLLEIN